MIIFIAVIHCEDPYFPAPLHMKLEGGCQRPKIFRCSYTLLKSIEGLYMIPTNF